MPNAGLTIALIKALGGGGGGGGGGMLVVEASSSDMGQTVTVDTSLADILAAVKAGKNVWAKLKFFGGTTLPLVLWLEASPGTPAQVSFSQTDVGSGMVMSLRLSIADNAGVDKVSFAMEQYPS